MMINKKPICHLYPALNPFQIIAGNTIPAWKLTNRFPLHDVQEYNEP